MDIKVGTKEYNDFCMKYVDPRNILPSVIENAISSTKYVLELFEFFESEPVVIGEEDAGEWIYTYKKDDFKIILLLSTYEMYIKISSCYCENIVYTEKFNQVIEIKRSDANTLRVIKDEKSILVKKESQIGVIVEEN